MKIFFTAFALYFVFLGFAQDTTENKKPKEIHPYKKALFLSAVLPGAGQVYNSVHTEGRKNAYWKVPLIYAGLSGAVYFIFQNQRQVQSIKTEYNQRKIGGNLDPIWMDYDNIALVSLYDQYARLRDFSILGLGGVYLIQMMDAAVEAHFLHFDVSKNLALDVRPVLMNRTTAGLRFDFKFR